MDSEALEILVRHLALGVWEFMRSRLLWQLLVPLAVIPWIVKWGWRRIWTWMSL